jgi:MFS transporter, DHA2 family, methylenomycin A resistance protein
MNLTETTPTHPPGQAVSNVWTIGIVLAVALGFIMAMLDVTVVNVALGDIQREFASPLSTLVWIVDAYTLTFASLLLLGGSFADWWGAKRAYIGGLLIFVSASALCGVSTSTGFLIAARLLQGCGAAAFLPSSLTLLTQSFPDTAMRTRMVGVWGAFIGAAAGSGPFVGGLLIHHFGWRSIFYLNLPVGALGVCLTAILLRPSQPSPRPFDIVSHLLMMAGLSSISFTLIEGPVFGWFMSRAIVLSTLGAVSAITLFSLRERTTPHPVIPHALLHNGPFWILNGVGFLLSFVIFGEIFVVSLLLEKARGASAYQTGIQMLPIMGVFAFVNYFAGRFAAVWGTKRIMTLGYGVAALGAVSTMIVGGSAGYWQLAITFAICNVGLGLAGPPLIARVMLQAGEAYANIGSATLSANRQIGALCGVAMMAIILDAIANWGLGVRVVFGVFAVLLMSALTLVHCGVADDQSGRESLPASPPSTEA